MAKHNVRFLVPYEGRIKYHEGLILRSTIALRVIYGNAVNVTVATNSPHFIDALHGPFSQFFPVMVIKKPELRRFNLKSYTIIVGSEEHPMLKMKECQGMDYFVVPGIDTKEDLDFESEVFGRTFNYPNLREIESLVPEELRKQKRKPQVAPV